MNDINLKRPLSSLNNSVLIPKPKSKTPFMVLIVSLLLFIIALIIFSMVFRDIDEVFFRNDIEGIFKKLAFLDVIILIITSFGLSMMKKLAIHIFTIVFILNMFFSILAGFYFEFLSVEFLSELYFYEFFIIIVIPVILSLILFSFLIYLWKISEKFI